jgi:hypothetical protein
MTETPDALDVFEACARLHAAANGATPDDIPLGEVATVSRADLALVLRVPLEHALSDEGIRRAMLAANEANGRRGYRWPLGDVDALRAAITAAIGGPR